MDTTTKGHTMTKRQPGLYYNAATGEINCERHAPHPMTDTGRRFRRLGQRDTVEADRIGLALRCELCPR